jgi:hypothetical protein
LRAATAFSAVETSAGPLAVVPGGSAIVGACAPLVVNQATLVNINIGASKNPGLRMSFSMWPKMTLPIVEFLSSDEFRGAVAPLRGLQATMRRREKRICYHSGSCKGAL